MTHSHAPHHPAPVLPVAAVLDDPGRTAVVTETVRAILTERSGCAA